MRLLNLLISLSLSSAIYMHISLVHQTVFSGNVHAHGERGQGMHVAGKYGLVHETTCTRVVT